MRPVINVVGPCLSLRDPPAVLLQVCRAVRCEHPHHFLDRHLAKIFSDEQVHQIIGVGQFSVTGTIDGNIAVQAQ